MKHVLLDTHSWAWSLTADARLSAIVTAVIEQAETVFVSAISLFEIGQQVRLGKWPEMAPFLSRLMALAEEQGAWLVEISPETSLLAATLDWAHRDPFDRIIGAAAIVRGLPLLSVDTAFDTLRQPCRAGSGEFAGYHKKRRIKSFCFFFLHKRRFKSPERRAAPDFLASNRPTHTCQTG